MVNMNRVIIAGYLAKDPEIRYIASGKAVCNFSIAINRSYKGADDQQKDEVSFFDVECWGRLAEIAAEHLHKGRPALLEGRLKQARWEAQGGGARSKVVIIAENIQFLGSPKDGHQGQSLEGAPQTASESPPTAAHDEINFDA